MPIYAYRCADCGHAKDVLQKISDPVLSTCPACGAESFKKQVTAAGFQLKGSGWYVTDFREGSKPAPAAPAAANGEGAGAETASNGAKPDAAKPDAAKSDAAKTASAAPAAAAPASAAPSAAPSAAAK